MANKDVLKITFDANAGIKELEQNLIGSMNGMSEEISKKLEDAFAKAGRNPKLKKQLTGIYQSLFDEFGDAAGNFKKIETAVDRFSGKIEYLNNVISKSKDNKGNPIKGLLDNLSIGNIDKILEDYDKVVEKKKELDSILSNEYRDGKRSETLIKSLKELEGTYGDISKAKEKYENKLNNFLKGAGVETSTISKQIEEYSSLIALFDKISNTKVQSGTDDAVKQSQALLYTMKQITNLENGNILLSSFRLNESDVKGITSSIAVLERNIEGSITTLINKMKKKLNGEISSILTSAAKEAEKMSQHQAIADTKIQAKITNKNVSGSGNDSQDNYDYDEHNNLFAKYFDTAKKSANELEELFYDIGDRLEELNKKAKDGNLVGKSLKEYIALYKQYEDIASKNSNLMIPSGYTKQFDAIIKNNKKLSVYANHLDEVKNKGYIDNPLGSGSVDGSKIEELREEIKEVKEDITSLKGRVDTLEDTTAFDALSSQVEGFNEKIKNVDGSVENLVSSFKLLSELSLTDLQKVVIPFFNGINQLYKENNGNHISGYWDKLKKEIEGSNTELRDLLKLVGLYDSKSNGLKTISDGMVNSGGLIGDNNVLIARKNKNGRIEQTNALKKALDDAHAAGINVSRILDIIGTKESDVFLEVQETAKGNILGNIYGQLDKDFVNTEWLESTDDQIKKLISDMIALQKMGINVESNLTNIMYDKQKGFSFIDMDLDITKFENDAELMQDHMIRIFGDLEDFYLTQNDSINANIIAKARERFESLSEQVQQAYAKAQDSHSPSKEFEKLENDAVDGIVEGANKNEDRLKNVGKQMADNIKDGFKEGIAEIGTASLSDSDQLKSLSGDPNTIQKVKQEIEEYINQYERSKEYFKDENLLYNIMVGKDGGVKTKKEFVTEINSMLKEAQQKISEVYNSGGELTEEEIINNYYGEAMKQLRAARAFGVVDLEDITAPYGNDQAYLQSMLDKFQDINPWSKQLEEMNDDSWSFIGNLIEQQERLNALQKNGGQDYIDVLEKTKALYKEINDVKTNNDNAGSVDKHTLDISEDDAMNKAKALELESQKIDDIIASLRALDTVENKYYVESFGYIKGKIGALEELQDKVEKDIVAYNSFKKVQGYDQVDIFSDATDKTLNKSANAPKELERYWERLEDSILDGSINGQEAIEKFNQKAQELGKTFDNIQKKWKDISLSGQPEVLSGTTATPLTEELRETVTEASRVEEIIKRVQSVMDGISAKEIKNSLQNLNYKESDLIGISDDEVQAITDEVLNGYKERFDSLVKEFNQTYRANLNSEDQTYTDDIEYLTKEIKEYGLVGEQAVQGIIDKENELYEAGRRFTDAFNEAKVLQDSVNVIPQAEGTTRLFHYTDMDNANKIMGEDFNFSKYSDITFMLSILGEVDEAMTKVETGYKDLWHAFDKGAAVIIDVPTEMMAGLKSYHEIFSEDSIIPNEYIKGIVDTNSAFVTLRDTMKTLDVVEETAVPSEESTKFDTSKIIKEIQELIDKYKELRNFSDDKSMQGNYASMITSLRHINSVFSNEDFDIENLTKNQLDKLSKGFDGLENGVIKEASEMASGIREFVGNLLTQYNVVQELNQTPLSSPIFEDESGQLSFIEQTKKTIDLIEEESGQMAMFENIAEKATDSAIEGQMTLNDILNKNIEGQMTLKDLASKNDNTVLPAESVKDTLDNVSAIKAETKAVEENTESLKENRQEQENNSNVKTDQPETLRKRLESIFENAQELKRVLKSLDEGTSFSFDWSDDDGYQKINLFKKALKEFGYTVKDVKEDTDSFSYSGKIVPINEELKKIDDIAEAYKEATKTLKKYYDLKQKEYSKGNVEDNDTLKSYKEELKDAIAHIGKYAAITEEAIKAQKKFDAVVNDYKNDFSSDIQVDLNSKFSSYENKKNKISEYYEIIKNIRSEIDKLKVPIDFINTDEIKELASAEKHINDMIKDLASRNNKEFNLVPEDKINNALNTAYKTLNKNTAAPKELRNNLKQVIAEFEKLKKSGEEVNEVTFDKLQNSLKEVQLEINKTGKTGASMVDKIQKKFGDVAAYFATYVSIQDAIQVVRQGFETIKEYDTALTEMNKVSKESIQTLKEFQKESFNLANSVGTTASQIQNSTADFLRLGESFDKAKQSAQDANALFKVSEFESINEATDALISMSQAYNELEKSEINDILNYVGNNFSLSTSDLATALQDAAAVLKTQGNDIYEAVALITAGNAITQDPLKTAGGVRTISLRIAGTEEAKEELESLGESVDDYIVQTKSKTQETIKNLTAVASNAGKGIDVLDANGNLRDTYDILLDISRIYKEIQEEDKKSGTNRANALVEYIAGKNRSNIASSILLNPELLESVYKESMANSEGSVAREMEAQLESIESHLNSLKNAWDSLWINENNREVITFFLDLAKGILEAVDSFGVLNTLLLGGSGIFAAIKSFKGEGKPKCSVSIKYALGNMAPYGYIRF